MSVVALLPLAACGGGGTSSTPPPPISTPTPTPPPAPAPTPPPTPAPTANFDTAEYRRSVGPSFHNAISAYTAGATGKGILVGVVDTGVDTTSLEFAGRISSASRDFGGNGTYVDEDGHGTAVSSVILGAKNDLETHGIAFDATLLTLRADTAGSCATEDPDVKDSGCKFSTSAIAAAVNHAVDSGARVINLSLGGGGIGTSLRTAITRAAAAGIVIVVSAGNDGESTDAGVDPNNPDPFAQGLAAAGNGRVIIAGSVGTAASQSEISAFSNRAGASANVYLTALGYRVRAPDENGAIYLWSGTSFSAPQIAGAAALLAQAFPNLTGAQIVSILLNSGRDVGAPGVDAIYGHGILDIARAFQPSGTTSLAGSKELVDTSADSATLSSPMGDAFASGSTQAIILDEYDRAFGLDLARTVRAPGLDLKLAPALSVAQRQLSASSPAFSVSLTVAAGSNEVIYGAQTLTVTDAEQARVLAGSVMLRLDPDTRLAFGIRRGSEGMSAALEGRSQPAFLVGESARGQIGFSLRPASGVAVRHAIGAGIGLTARAETGIAQVRETRPFEQLRTPLSDYRYSIVGVGLDKSVGAARFALNGEMLNESETVLGAKFGSLYGGKGARSAFVDTEARVDIGAGWALGGAWRQGWTWANAGGNVVSGSLLKSSAWSLDATKAGVFGSSDSFALRIAQPLRVSAGGLRLNLPVGYDYATLATEYGVRTLNLAPTGREVDIEGVYGVPVGATARLTANAYYRKDPGNIAALGNDIGGAIRFTLGF
ncbi:S8 family peptidase [Flavisphingopyxis soli]|uniref:S8 family peptidase n=1 Tax=Flavisphingopyxis soli TaxID=2601267 RepID=UPI001F23866D|nr:S8 family peptidase [Sphingorhabdus soli]